MSIDYEIPEEYYFRVHHIRPRFKNDVESVLIYIASEISKLPPMVKDDFMESVNKAIKRYPGNATKTPKTINNWRTEISSLFGLIVYNTEYNTCAPGAITKTLAENQDLIEFFKYFLYYFQYPGAHLKTYEIMKFIEAGIKFKPAKYILDLLYSGEKKEGKRFGITKAELTHCVFNDLRVTRDGKKPSQVVDLIIENRKKNAKYNWSGDIIRYAGDILDYMVLADLLVQYGNTYYLNLNDQESIAAFRKSNVYFNFYNPLYGKKQLTLDDVNVFYDQWYHFVNREIKDDIFKTDLFKYLGIDRSEYTRLQEISYEEFYRILESKEEIKTKEIGDFGENLVHGHECMRIKLAGREDLIHLIMKIPSAFAMGFDIHSVEPDETKRYIEVKTTISQSSITFNKFHMTTNEWKTAESLRERYFVYRLMVSKDNRKMFIIRDPVSQYKADTGAIEIMIRDGADVTFNDSAGKLEGLLIWAS